MYRFWDISDLGFSYFYFSCKHYQELALARITKVVVFLTTNLTKLGLHFSDFSTILYEFYNIQQITYTIWESNFAQAPGTFHYFTYMPSVYKNNPGKIREPAIGSLGQAAGDPCRIPARSGRGQRGEGGGGPVAHQWIDLHWFRRSGTSAASALRSPAVASAGASAPVKGGGAGTHMRHRAVAGGLCGAVMRLVGGGKVGRQELAAGIYGERLTGLRTGSRRPL
jgi:hypothetical protein